MSVPDLVIREIRARPVVAPLPRPIRTASGDVMDAPLLLRSLAQFVRDIAPELIGKSVSPRARMRQMEKRLKLVGWQGFAGMVVGTLDMALWDARARTMDVPLAVLLGGEIRPLPAYDSFGMLDHRTDLPWLEKSVASGFKAIKIKFGAGDVESDVAIVADVRRTIGGDVRLMLDFNQSQCTAGAVERIRRLQDFDLTWVEEPVAAEDLVGHRAVRERVRPVPIQTGENWWFPR